MATKGTAPPTKPGEKSAPAQKAAPGGARKQSVAKAGVGKGKPSVAPAKKNATKNKLSEVVKTDEMKLLEAQAKDGGPNEVPSADDIAAAKKKSMSRYGNLITDQTSDHWEAGLIPQVIIDEIYADLQYDSGSDVSEESYEEVTESGTILKKYRKKRRLRIDEEEVEEEEEEETEDLGPQRISVPDIEGGIPKAKLKTMSVKKLNSIHKKIDLEIEFIQTENFIFDRTVKKMEKRELEIEAALPAFTYEFPWEKNNSFKSKGRDTTQDICEAQLSSDEENDTGDYVPFIPGNEIDFSDPYFDDMSDHMREATANQMRDLGEIAPNNFDIIRHTYKDLVKPVLEKDDGNEDEGDPSEIHDVNQPSEKGKNSPSASQALLMNNGLESASKDQMEDEDPEYPGFVLKQAKKLPIGEKLKYANIEEEKLRDEFFDDETNGIQQENSIQVYIDTFVNSVELIRKLQDSFKDVLAGGHHPLTGRMRAESIVRFRILMKNRLLAEETKLTMALNELRKQKKKVDEQVKSNRELGESIQLIDYEQLRIENAQFQGNIDEQQDILKQLKIITAGCFQYLKDHRARLQRKMIQLKHITDDITVRGILKDGFDENTRKYSGTITDVRGHNEFLRKRLKVFKAPSTIDYMHQKATQNVIQDELVLLKKKLESMQMNLKTVRANIRRLQKKVPAKDLRQLNKDWLEGIKTEVAEKGLINLLENEKDPMGGSMRQFFKRKGAGPVVKVEDKGTERKDSDTPSKIKLGPAELTKAKETKELTRRQTIFMKSDKVDTSSDHKKDSDQTVFHPEAWKRKKSSARRSGPTENDPESAAVPATSVQVKQARRKTMSTVKSTFEHGNRVTEQVIMEFDNV